MAFFGLIGLLVAFAAVAVSLLCLLVGHLMGLKGPRDSAETLLWGGHIATFCASVALTFCCGLLIFCFMTGDTSIQYVVEYRSNAEGLSGLLYKLAGLWGGREGSLLLWAWLIALFTTVLALRNMKILAALDNMALFVSQLVLAAFVGILLFSETNIPFVAMAASYFDTAGNLTNGAQLWGMNALLEHWAMAIHPPTTFIGYAGLTIPFAYALAALIVNDSSKTWVIRASRYTLLSWLFLGIGIGLGAVWAYVVLGWGGYWGWDPVENASLLPWLIGIALVHSFTVYRQRGAFKRWSVFCACIAFSFVILGTFITRSGVVQSVHAFAGDTVSLSIFLLLIVVSTLAGVVGLALRWRDFAPVGASDHIDSLLSKNAAYYFNNVAILLFTLLLAYLTVSGALPTWLPFGGQSFSAGSYNTIARPLGIAYCLIIAVCPLLAWKKTEGQQFWRRARAPGIGALALFALLLIYFITNLLPMYDAVATSGARAATVTDYGPSWYYLGLTLLGFLVASLLFFNSLFMLARGIRAFQKTQGRSLLAAALGMFRCRAATYGGFLAHLAMAVILVGLIGSSMYVVEKVDYLSYDPEIDGTQQNLKIWDYTLTYTSNSITELENGSDILYALQFDVYRGDTYVGQVNPAVQLATVTQQQKLLASVINFPDQDLFVVYRGVNAQGDYSMDVRVNPLISLVWIGFGLLMIGTALAALGRRRAVDTAANTEARTDTEQP
ncbi:MAG: cytochrome c biogenesis protein CcsA [Coriobacteriales bacterium]|jgi:cytochrome c-type biogenesis protein CcmF|nr:cytochrome c biogenesis protein CcsA [Coriobacteriales bacterium]